MFEVNVGGMDRIVRLCLGVALIAMVFFPPNTPWGWLGIIPLLTGALGRCPLYSLLGIDTCPLD